MMEQLESLLQFFRAILDCIFLVPDYLVFLLSELLEVVGNLLLVAAYYFLFALAISPINLFVSHITSKVAGQHLADPDYWFWIFLIFPGLGQMFFLVTVLSYNIRSRARLKEKGLFDLLLRALYLNELAEMVGRTEAPVTPFKESTVSNVLEVARWPTAILDEWHDSKIDEFIEWKLWRKAFERARNQLKKARLACDRRSVEIYRAYTMLLLPYVDSKRFNRLLEFCEKKGQPLTVPPQ